MTGKAKAGATLCFWGPILAVVAGYGAELHPVGDSLAVFRAQGVSAILLLSGGAVLLGHARAALFGALVAAYAGLPVVWAYSPLTATAGEGSVYMLYQKNLSFRNPDLTRVLADIRVHSPDFLTLQEVTQGHLAALAGLDDILPYRHVCGFAAVGGTAIASRFAPVQGTISCSGGMAMMQVITPDGPVWLASLHLHWPWPYGQAGQVQKRLPVLDGLGGPVILAGDFNMVPWSRTIELAKAATRTKLAGPVRNSFPRFGPLFSLPIDHVLTPTGGLAERQPLFGSDHYGLLVRFSL